MEQTKQELIDFLYSLTMYVDCASPETREGDTLCGPDAGCIPCQARALLDNLCAAKEV